VKKVQKEGKALIENKGVSEIRCVRSGENCEVEENARVRGKWTVDRDVASVRESTCRILIKHHSIWGIRSQAKSEVGKKI